MILGASLCGAMAGIGATLFGLIVIFIYMAREAIRS